MIKILIPYSSFMERRYILHVMIGEFLGLKFKTEINKSKNEWKICLDNGNVLTFYDAFFGKFSNNIEYLKIENIPTNITFAKNQFIANDSIPILYGKDELFIDDACQEIHCGIDIFASSFFMLTRWEEYVNKNRDNHDRFSAKDSVAYKNGFLNRPIVNEYVEMLKNMLLYLDKNIVFKEHKFQKFITCDVDEPFDHTVKNFYTLAKTCAGDLIKRKNLRAFLNRTKRYIFNKFENYKYDDNYIFDWYMDACEKAGLKAAFYFIPTSKEPGNGRYELSEKRIQNLLNYIYGRGHEIGVHGSYQTYKDFKKTAEQKELLEKCLRRMGLSNKVIGNRQHYLRWDSSITPAVLDNAGFEYDTSGSYADVAGFRYGCCYEFSMFDFINRKKLNIKQRPLIVMECSVIDEKYMGMDYKKGFEYIQKLKDECKKYGGNFVLLWHNSYLKTKSQKDMFVKILNIRL